MISIFNPVKVFTDEFSSSWAANIKTVYPTSSYIPINKTSNPPTLVLDSLPDVKYFVGVLPVNRDGWISVDLSSYSHLKFNISATKTEYPHVELLLSSKSTNTKDSAEFDSDPISLIEHGLMPECTQEFIIPLDEFKGNNFDIKCARFIKFRGSRVFSVSLSEIIIE